VNARGPLLAFAFALAACGPGTPEPTPAPTPSAVRVERVDVVRELLVEPVFGTGTLAAHKTSQIGPRVDGIIETIHVHVGHRVAEGQELFRTRPVDYEIRVREAAHGQRLARAEADKALRDFARVETLHGKGVASSEQLDAARTAREIALARVGGAETASARARQDLDDTVVRAPYAGVITRRYVDEGTMLRTMMSSSSAVLEIMKTDVVVAIVSLPEVYLPRVRVGTRARVHVDGAERDVESAVAVLNDRVDAASRAFEVRIPIENPDLSLKPGLFARAELLPEPRDATLVERRAVLGVGEERYVMVAEGGRAARRPVRVRELDATRFEVVEGISPGDAVLAGPNLSLLAEGTPVTFEVARVDR
jgi:RND family efflux transporter MFP subunit